MKWFWWIFLILILLPIASLFLIKLSGSMKMRIPDDQIMGALHAYPIIKQLDTLIIRNREIAYLHTAKNEAKKKDAIIFLHGSPGSLDVYLKYMHSDTLLSRADLIAYDRPGFGHSGFGNSMPSLRQQSFVLFDLMKHLDYERYWLIGHSYGAAVIIQAAIDKPDRIAGIGIIAGSVVYEMNSGSGWRSWMSLPFIQELLPDALRVSNEELIALKIDLRMTDDDWSQITMPVSLINGKKDILVPFQDKEKALEKLTNADTVLTLTLPEENYYLLSSQADQILEEIVKLMEMKDEI